MSGTGETTIRPALSADHAQVHALFAQVDAMHRARLPEVFRASPGPARAAGWWEERIAGQDCALLVADHMGELLGLVELVDSAAPSSPLHHPRRHALIDTLVVKEGHQRRGIGRALMEAAHAWAIARGLGQVQLNVWEANPEARAFYEALGYATLSRKLGRRLS